MSEIDPPRHTFSIGRVLILAVPLALAVWGAKIDARFLEVFARHLKHRSFLDA